MKKTSERFEFYDRDAQIGFFGLTALINVSVDELQYGKKVLLRVDDVRESMSAKLKPKEAERLGMALINAAKHLKG